MSRRGSLTLRQLHVNSIVEAHGHLANLLQLPREEIDEEEEEGDGQAQYEAEWRPWMVAPHHIDVLQSLLLQAAPSITAHGASVQSNATSLFSEIFCSWSLGREALHRTPVTKSVASDGVGTRRLRKQALCHRVFTCIYIHVWTEAKLQLARATKTATTSPQAGDSELPLLRQLRCLNLKLFLASKRREVDSMRSFPDPYMTPAGE